MCFPGRPVLLFTVLALMADVSIVSAFRETSARGRFEGRVARRAGGVIAVTPRNVDRLEAADPLRVGWRTFRTRTGGAWSVYVDERTGVPTLVSGSGIEWFKHDDLATLTLDVVASRSRSFLTSHAVLLGLDPESMVLDSDASGEVRPNRWQVVFRQEVDGVPVARARFDLHIDRGRLTMFGGSGWAQPTRSGIPDLDEAAAREILDDYLGVATRGLDPVETPELMLIALDAAPSGDRPAPWVGARGMGIAHRLVWRLRFREPGAPELWTAEIDAHTGELVAFRDDAHYTAIRGGVFPITPDGDCAAGGCEIEGFPMPYADYLESSAVDAYADEFGNLTCVDPGAGFQTTLVGSYVRIQDACGAVAEPGTCSTGADLGSKAGENCEVASGATAGNTAAARSGYYHINRVAEVARHYHPNNSWLADSVTLNSNVSSTCNAVWNGAVNMYRAGDGCNNTGEIQGVVVHEWGHGYDENDGGGYDNTSEAYADVVALFAARESCMGRGFYNDGRVCSGYGETCLSCTGIRDLDWAARTANTPATPQGFVQDLCPGGNGPCGYESHCEAYPIGEAIFDLATRDLPAAGFDAATSWQIAERLWFETRDGSGGDIYTCALPDSDSCGAGTWYQRMRVADDDDGNLANGTPHAAALYAAFVRHNIACGLVDDPGNQSTTSCPAIAAPELSVVELPQGTELSWPAVSGADEYVVYRGELGCDRQQVAMGTVGGQGTSWVDVTADPDLPRYYRVEAVGANPACRSAVSACEATPTGPRLQLHGQRIVEVGPNSNFNGFADPGETVQVPVTLFNSGVGAAGAVSGRIAVLDGSVARAVVPDALWADIPAGFTEESSTPHFELIVSEEVACGSAHDVRLDIDAAGAATRSRTLRLGFGEFDRDFVQNQPRYIPAETFVPVVSTLELPGTHTLAELDVSVKIDIFGADTLTVELSSPGGTTVKLHDQSSGFFGIDTRYDLLKEPDGPGSMADFTGESTAGTWTLSIMNAGGMFGTAGTLLGWTLHASVLEPFDCEPYACSDPTPIDSVHGLRIDKTGAVLADLNVSWVGLAGVAGYHVLESTVAGFDGAIGLTARTAGAVTATVPDGAAAGGGLTFYQVRAINDCGQEGP